jgi:UDP-glucose 4-epimerase
MKRSITNTNIMITGGAGFIGSHLADGLIKNSIGNLVVIDNLFLGTKQNLNFADKYKKFYFFNDDACDPNILSYIIDKFKIETVFNCATKPLNYSFINPKSAFDINTSITLNLLELQRKNKFNTLCHFSTSEVYGTSVSDIMDETHPVDPTTPYAAGKLAADMAVLSYNKTFGLDCFIVRPFNNFGPRQNAIPPLAGIVPLTINRILEGLSPIVHGNGLQSRDFNFVKDTINNVIRLFSIIDKGEIVNISSNNEIKIIDLVSKISKKMGYVGNFKILENRSADVFRHKGSSKKLKSLIKQEVTEFDSALNQTIEWYSR